MTKRCIDPAPWGPRLVAVVEGDPSPDRSLLAHLDVVAGRETVAIIAVPASSSATARADEVAAVLDDHLVVVVAGDDEHHLAARARELTGTDHGAGLAIAPFDGIDASALVESACAACDRAAAGAVLRAEDVVERIVLGNRVAVVADPTTARVYELARRLARSAIPITISGPTGSGKELVVAAIHQFSPRAHQPLVAVNCAVIPEGLAEAELFGHAKGAFTGAIASRAGLIEASSGGTLFLDEIAELSPATQARLLRVLESNEVQRIGETTRRPIDLHVVAATHRDLAKEVAAGRFREDLWYRLGVARVDLLPLHQRPRDLAALIRRFTAEAGARSGRPEIELAAATARALFARGWPGNVRELRHAIEFAMAAAAGGSEILPEHLPAVRADARSPKRVVGGQSIAAELRALERHRMIEALAACRGAQTKAAALIQMPLRSFVTKVKRYGITERDWRGAASG